LFKDLECGDNLFNELDLSKNIIVKIDKENRKVLISFDYTKVAENQSQLFLFEQSYL